MNFPHVIQFVKTFRDRCSPAFLLTALKRWSTLCFPLNKCLWHASDLWVMFFLLVEFIHKLHHNCESQGDDVMPACVADADAAAACSCSCSLQREISSDQSELLRTELCCSLNEGFWISKHWCNLSYSDVKKDILFLWCHNIHSVLVKDAWLSIYHVSLRTEPNFASRFS